MDISIIIPTYKPQDYIWECLISIKMQTFQKTRFEVLIILNGCKEPYYSEITSFLQTEFQNMNFRVIHIDSKGVSNARNVGIEAAQGKYLTFIDDDDFVSPSYLHEMYLIAEKGIVPISNMMAFDDSNRNIMPYYASRNFKKYCNKTELNIFHMRSFFSTSACKLLSSNIIVNCRYNIQFEIGEDSLFMFNLSKNVVKIASTSKNAIYYRRIRSNSVTLSGISKINWLRIHLQLFEAYVKLWLRNPLAYNFTFFVSRLAATAKTGINYCFTKPL